MSWRGESVLPQYSVLMSVYYKEQPEFLRASMESMFAQTVPTDNFVLVCDGPLNEPLDRVVQEMQGKHGNILNVVRLEKNVGLGNALNEGLQHCKHELVARMDSDDISCPERCELELNEFAADHKLDIISGVIEEFSTTPNHIVGKRTLPISYREICDFSKKRNPFNHPAVMVKKSAIMAAGGYDETYHLFEDYYLWVRMLINGCYAKNIPDTILLMRVPTNLYLRRGGKKYAKDMLRFHQWMRKYGWSDWWSYLTCAIPHAIICLMPNRVRKCCYKLIRKAM